VGNTVNNNNVFINPSPNIQFTESKPIVKEAIGNFFESIGNSENNISWKDDLPAMIANATKQFETQRETLKSGDVGNNFNSMF